MRAGSDPGPETGSIGRFLSKSVAQQRSARLGNPTSGLTARHSIPLTHSRNEPKGSISKCIIIHTVGSYHFLVLENHPIDPSCEREEKQDTARIPLGPGLSPTNTLQG
jgi:hypothetical protein